MRSWRSAFTGRPGRISVAMATYNGERYLPEMLESLAAQTRLPDELVVRDDGSTDGTRRRSCTPSPRRVPFRVEVHRRRPAPGLRAELRRRQPRLLRRPDLLRRPGRRVAPAEAGHGRRSTYAAATPRAFFHDFALHDRRRHAGRAVVLRPARRARLPAGRGPEGLQHGRHPGLRRHVGLAAARRRRSPTTSGWRCWPPRSASAATCPSRPDRPPDPRGQRVGLDPRRRVARSSPSPGDGAGPTSAADRPGAQAAAARARAPRAFLDVARRARRRGRPRGRAAAAAEPAGQPPATPRGRRRRGSTWPARRTFIVVRVQAADAGLDRVVEQARPVERARAPRGSSAWRTGRKPKVRSVGRPAGDLPT